jgi:hypothetical protein
MAHKLKITLTTQPGGRKLLINPSTPSLQRTFGFDASYMVQINAFTPVEVTFFGNTIASGTSCFNSGDPGCAWTYVGDLLDNPTTPGTLWMFAQCISDGAGGCCFAVYVLLHHVPGFGGPKHITISKASGDKCVTSPDEHLNEILPLSLNYSKGSFGPGATTVCDFTGTDSGFDATITEV